MSLRVHLNPPQRGLSWCLPVSHMQAWINHCIQENWPVWDLFTLDMEKSELCDETLAMEEASIKKKKKMLNKQKN